MNLDFARRKLVLGAAGMATGLGPAGLALAQQRPPGGAEPRTIRIGQTMPYSGPASAYGTIGRVHSAYFRRVNERGGINGRQVQLISLDDGYNPAKTVEQTRRLVEQDEVLAIFNPLGTACNNAIHKYLNTRGVPHLLVSSGATKWGDPKHFPWTIGFSPSYQTEGAIYAGWLLKTKPAAKVGVLLQNDDFGRDLLKGFRDALGARAASMIVAEQTYEVTDPTVDSQILALQAAGVDTLLNIATPKQSAQAIRKSADIGWKPLHIVNNVGSSVGSVLVPAGVDKAVGLVTLQYYKDPNDPQWKDDPAMLEWRAFMGRHYREGDPRDTSNVYGYFSAQALEQILKQAGNDLSRANLMKQAANLKQLRLPLLLPGVVVDTGPADFFPIEQGRLARFDGTQWVTFGDVVSAPSRPTTR